MDLSHRTYIDDTIKLGNLAHMYSDPDCGNQHEHAYLAWPNVS